MVTVRVANQKTFFVHKNLLTQHSSWFRNRLGDDDESEEESGQPTRIDLAGVSIDTFKIFIGWLYSGELPDLEDARSDAAHDEEDETGHWAIGRAAIRNSSTSASNATRTRTIQSIKTEPTDDSQVTGTTPSCTATRHQAQVENNLVGRAGPSRTVSGPGIKIEPGTRVDQTEDRVVASGQGRGSPTPFQGGQATRNSTEAHQRFLKSLIDAYSFGLKLGIPLLERQIINTLFDHISSGLYLPSAQTIREVCQAYQGLRHMTCLADLLVQTVCFYGLAKPVDEEDWVAGLEIYHDMNNLPSEFVRYMATMYACLTMDASIHGGHLSHLQFNVCDFHTHTEE